MNNQSSLTPLKPDPNEITWMLRAIYLAEKGRFTAKPNPCVGCVLVKDGGMVGEGWHYRAGEAHAEVNALQSAGHQSEGAEAYVTLEPCNHYGRTAPCTEALINAGIKRVVYAMKDPNPEVSGKGLSTLKAAGIEVHGPLLEEQARALNPGFLSRMERQRPWLRCKMACSLDGRTAMASGESHWITGPPARSDVQRWRARSSAIITGIQTVLHDNSRLTLRADQLDLENAKDAIERPPLRVVLDAELQTPLDAAIVNTEAPTLILTSERALGSGQDKASLLSESNAQLTIHSVPVSKNGRLSLQAILNLLAKDYLCNEVLVEAGATLSGAFLQENLIDELIVYQAPILLGSDARSLFELPIEQLSNKIQLEILDKREFGKDQRIIARPKFT